MSSASTAAQPLPPPIPTHPVQDVTLPRSWIGRVMLDTVGQTGARIGLAWIALVAFCAIFAPLLANSHPYLIKIDGAWRSPLVENLTGVDVLLLALAAASAIILPLRRFSLPQRIALIAWVLAALLPFAFWKPILEWYGMLRLTWGTMQSHILTGALIALLVLGLIVDAVLAVIIPLVTRVSLTTKLLVLMGIAVLATVLVIWPVHPRANPVYDEWRTAEADGRIGFILNAPIPYSPSDRLRDMFDIDRPHPWAPSGAHLMGTEVNGADILSNMIHACRIAMSIGFISTGIAVVIGIIVGGLMGYFVGWVDLLGMRLVEIFSAIPTLYLLLMCVAFFGRNLYLMMVIIGFTSWVGDARFVRAEFLKLRNQDFVHAAIATGLPLRSILFRHLLPNALAPLLVSVSFGVASAILIESTLSFLGLGLVDEPSWGRLLDLARGAGGGFYWWLALYPGLAIFLTVLGYNLVGESLRDALDPRLHKSE